MFRRNRMMAWLLTGMMVILTAMPVQASQEDTGGKQQEATTEREVSDVEEATKRLQLSFEDNILDSSSYGWEVQVKGNTSFVEGAKQGTKAFQFDGSTYLDLGTSPLLNPSNLTVSFWVNPSDTMSGEQLFVWNKEQWYSDGWYVSSENDNVPLAISIGSANENKQPYKVGVNANRSEFFPVGEWTHVTITFNNTTKEVSIYRNGVPQTVSVHYNVGADGADATIDQDNTMKKAIGYNGPIYKGAFAKIGMDEFMIADEVYSQEEVIKVYEECREFQDESLVKDYEALQIATMTSSNITLPTVGANGSTITWTTSDASVMTADGKVTVPAEGSKKVTMTATLSYKGKTLEKTFEVSVQKATLVNNGMDRVTLSDDYMTNAVEKENAYLLSMSSKKFLYEFYKVAGLTPATESGYGGWERSDQVNFRGHFFGHYMSALSQAYLASNEETEKAALYEQMLHAVEGLQACQDAYAKKYPQSAGYISAFRENILNSVEGTGSSDENVLVPYYNLHKVLAGLIDIARNVQDDELGEQALQVACGFGDYLYNRSESWSEATKNKVLTTEYGGMNEALYELYYITGNENYKSVAECFDETNLFTQLAGGKDVLQNKHANTTIPKLIGALKRHQVMEATGQVTDTEKMYLEAAINFWDIVTENHSYITGGNSQSEHFRAPNSQGQYADNVTCETCNTYNMLKLSRALFQVTGDKKYMDYYENTYINAILSSQNPETGMTMYFQPMASGYYKLYSSEYESFWCCTGTGIESFTKLGDTIYMKEDNNLYINMFFSSAYDDGTLSVMQTANMPTSEEVSITVNKTDGTPILVRKADWLASDITMKKNGSVVTPVEVNGYFVLDAASGDTFTITMPMEVTLDALPDRIDMIAFKYGPMALSCGLGTKDMDKVQGAGIMVFAPVLDRTAINTVNIMSGSLEEWKASLKENLVRIEDSADGEVQFVLNGTDQDGTLVYTPHYKRYQERYGLYMTFAEPDSEYLQKQILENKEVLREKEVSSSYITNFDDNNIENQENLQKSDNSTVGTYGGRQFRDAHAGGWFSYQLKVNQEADKNYLCLTYTTADKGRSFDIYLNGEKFVTEKIDATGHTVTSDGFYTIRREIPTKYLTSDQLTSDGRITVKFQSTGGLVGGVYGIAITSDYDTNAALQKMITSVGTWNQAFDPEVTKYTITVPKITEEVVFEVAPTKLSGLVYIGDILFDDTQARKVDFTEETKTIVFTSKAQDHTTEKMYEVTLVRETDIVEPTATPVPTVAPTVKPTATPLPTVVPTVKPTATPAPTVAPTVKPTATPNVSVKSVSLNKSNLNLAVKEITTLVAKINPTNATNQQVIWKSSDSSVVSVSTSGRVVAKKPGTATITVITKDGKKTATCYVKVKKTTIKLSTNMVILQEKQKTAEVTLKSSSVTGDKIKSAKTSNSKIATVFISKGKVHITAKKKGTATVTVTTTYGGTATIKVMVTTKGVATKTLRLNKSKATITRGKAITLTVTRKPFTANDKLTWTTSNKGVATVSSKGVVKAKKKGTATITVRSASGKKASCKITVK